MAILERVMRPAAARPGSGGSRRGLEEITLGGQSSSGVAVTEEGALRLAAVYACVRVLSETVGMLPLILYERLERGKGRAVDHPLYRILHNAPNPLMTRSDYWRAVTAHVALWGNSYSEIEFDGGGRVIGLWPLLPGAMREVKRTSAGLMYVYQLPDGREARLPGEKVLHLRAMSPDGITGYSPIRLAREAVGMGMAVGEFGARFFRNGARPGGVLEHPGVLDDDAFDRVKADWAASHGGLKNAHRTAILEEGMTYRAIGVPPDEAQFLESMKYNRTDIAAIFRVPPHMIGDLERATFSNIEQQSIDFMVFSMGTWLDAFQTAVSERLLGDGERERYFAEFLPDALLRGDTVSRFQSYSIAIQNGWMSRNEVRERENMNPFEGGDEYLVPLNMGEAGEEEEEKGEGEEEGRKKRLGDWEIGRLGGREIRAGQMEAAGARHKLAEAYRPIFADVATRIVKRETNDIGNAARRLLGKGRREDFEEWLAAFWGDHLAYVERQYGPVMRSYAAVVAEAARKELGAEEAPEAETFVDAYTRAAAERHVGRQEARLGKEMRKVEEEEEIGGLGDLEIEGAEEQGSGGEGEVDWDAVMLEAVEGLMLHWREVEPDRIAAEESIRGNNALAIVFYKLLGATRKVWVTFGDNCPYCDDLAGRSIGIDSFFLSVGQAFLPAGAESPLTLKSNVGHAPAHEGCDCMVVAG